MRVRQCVWHTQTVGKIWEHKKIKKKKNPATLLEYSSLANQHWTSLCKIPEASEPMGGPLGKASSFQILLPYLSLEED